MNLNGGLFHRDTSLVVDTYMDRTFHWGCDSLVGDGKLPYISPWIGFLHHTFDTTHSQYNCKRLLKNPVFLASLDVCKGVIVLSNYLAKALQSAFEQAAIHVPIHVLYHPTEFASDRFTMEKFLANDDKKVVQIGAWLRNPYAIYELPVYKDDPHTNPLGIHKCALKGKDMADYFAPEGLFDLMADVLTHHDHQRDNRIENNKYVMGMLDSLGAHHKSVRILQRLSNTEYDDLLSENIVFLSVVDASAVNTVMECIVRHTPILVNRHPALEEVLGQEYPGFYVSLAHASQILGSVEQINTIHTYLGSLNKEPFKLEVFLDAFQSIVESIKI